MKIAFIGNALDSGGAQKMLAYTIGSVAELADEIYIFLENTDDIVHTIPEKSKLIKLQNKIVGSKKESVISKFERIISYKNQVRDELIKNDISLICAFGAFYVTVAVLASKRTTVKVIGSERRSPQHLSFYWKAISKYSYGKCDAMAFQIQGARDFYRSVKDENAFVIPNPYFCKNEVSPCKAKDRKKVIAMAAARLEHEKGFDVGIRAMDIVAESHPDYEMEIYGAGDFDATYGEIMRSLKHNPKIVYKGLSDNIIADIYDSAVFVLPSRSEGIPNMLIEALGAGMPSVAADCPPGGPKMLLKNNTRGILVEMENHVETAKAICLLVENKELSDKYSDCAQSVKEEFQPCRISGLWKDCFKTVLDRS